MVFYDIVCKMLSMAKKKVTKGTKPVRKGQKPPKGKK